MQAGLTGLPAELLSGLSLEGIGWLVFGSVLAGLVRGFSGFGTAMVFLPFAGSVLPPVGALTAMVVMDLIGPTAMVPRTVKYANVGDLTRLAAGCLVGLPFGVAILLVLSADLFRYMVSFLTLFLLLLLVAGFRYSGELSSRMVYGTGGLGGFLAGVAGLPGPPVIMFYLASSLPAAAIRANLFIYLVLADALILAAFAIQGILESEHVVAGLVVAIPYLAALALGSLLFQPGKEKTYRTIAYCIIAASAIGGFPFLH